MIRKLHLLALLLLWADWEAFERLVLRPKEGPH